MFEQFENSDFSTLFKHMLRKVSVLIGGNSYYYRSENNQPQYLHFLPHWTQTVWTYQLRISAKVEARVIVLSGSS